MSAVRLSICIPTYNFGEFIGETLQSIIKQSGEEVEIVIGDGASTDNTEEIVKSYQALSPNIFYKKFDKKGGVDVDLAKTIGMARGEYCWLLSSDDVLRNGAIQQILDQLKFGHAIYLCNRIDCDRELREMGTRHWLYKRQGDDVFDFSVLKELKAYLKLSKGLGAMFSFISSIIVRREEWDSVSDNADTIGSNYAHVHRFFSIAKNGGCVKYIKSPLVLARHYNDSFMANGVANRFYIDLDGYELLMKQLFNDPEIIDLARAVMRREHKWYFFVGLRNRVSKAEWVELERRFVTCGYHPFQLFVIKLLGSSKLFVSSARRISRIFT